MEQTELVNAVADEVLRRLAPLLRQAPATDPEYIPLNEVAERTSFSYDFVYDAVHRGDLPATKKNREWRVSTKDMRAWMDRDRAGHPRPARSELKEKVSQLMPGLVR